MSTRKSLKYVINNSGISKFTQYWIYFYGRIVMQRAHAFEDTYSKKFILWDYQVARTSANQSVKYEFWHKRVYAITISKLSDFNIHLFHTSPNLVHDIFPFRNIATLPYRFSDFTYLILFKETQGFYVLLPFPLFFLLHIWFPPVN